MLEGLVQNLLVGYIGSYVKNIQKEQLKIGLWSGQVLLENVELNLQAFDNLQLPLSLKQGRVGRLSIKIPWKKLGWDPIMISLENVFIYACERDDHEWSSDSVERREYAGKKARLDAAEVAKLTRRVSGGVSETKIGQAFISHITAKILDGIQVSATDVQFIYTSKQSDSEQFVFGLQFSSLTMKQNNTGSSGGKLVDKEVNKSVEISSLGVYCNPSHGTIDELICGLRFDRDKLDYILVPCNVAVHLVVNRSGQVEDGDPQYSIVVELNTLVLQLNDIQMRQILSLGDYLGTCHLREKYGRFRPCHSTLCSKPEGWQKMWWQYAQESVLSDIRKRLRKTSRRYLGWRISYRRKYVSLYKNFIQQPQPVDKDILFALEQMEKEIDVDDILTYRSIAERESQEFLLSSTPPTVIRQNSGGRQQNDEGSSVKAQRGWINLLSLGMLGAGGTEDPIQFSGVVSDEIVEDIYEVTQFHPTSSLEGDVPTKNGIFLFSIKFGVDQINATLVSKTSEREGTKIILSEVNILFKLWEESWNVLTLVHSLEMDDLCTKKAFIFTKKGSTKGNLVPSGQPFITFEVDMPSVNREPELSIKAVFEPFEVTYEPDFLLNLRHFYLVLKSFQFQSQRVIASLNGFENASARLLSKSEYVFSNRAKVKWDASFSSFLIRLPERRENSEVIMVMEFGSLLFRSRDKAETPAVDSRDQQTGCTAAHYDIPFGIQLEDLYEKFEIVLTNISVNSMFPTCSRAISLLDRCNASLTLASCIIPDESLLMQLEVNLSLSSLSIHFSPSIYGALMRTFACLSTPELKSESVQERPTSVDDFRFSFSGDFRSVNFHVDVADDAEDDLVIILALDGVSILCASQEVLECWFCFKTLNVNTCTSNGESSCHTLCSSRTHISNSGHQSDTDVGVGISSENSGDRKALADGCFLLQYQVQKSAAVGCQKYSIYLADLDFHIYPKIVGLLCRFSDQLSGYGPSSSADSSKISPVSGKSKDKTLKFSSELQKFGFSNYFEVGPKTLEGISLECFPFVTIHNSGSLGSLEPSLIHGIPEWRRHFCTREGKSVRRMPKYSYRKRFRTSSVLNLKPLSHSNFCIASKGSHDSDLQLVDLDLNNIKVYLHDTSCILATLTLPLCKSLLIVEDGCLDMSCSIDGLHLSSSWATQCVREFLWGYTVPNVSPILNFRLRKNDGHTSNQNFEISISVQHVCCVLPSEFLAILIGYFSLPDWSPNGCEKFVTENQKQMDNEKNGTIWKIEILDSKLILPTECNKAQSLHLGIPQLYCSFTTMNHKEEALKDIPLDCVVPAQKVVDNVNLLNIFGRDLCLSLFLLKDDVFSILDHDTGPGYISLISQFCADLWIRIPCESKHVSEPGASTCIMTKINNCHIIAEDKFFLVGSQAVVNIVDELSTVGEKSEGFKSDVIQFLQFKKILKESNPVCPNATSTSFTEVRCCVSSLSINLYQSRSGDSPELVSKVDMQFELSASLRNEMPICLDVVFSSLALHSFRSSVCLVQCTSDGSVSVLFLHFAKSKEGINELLVDLPSLRIWLHMSDWYEVIELLVSYSVQLTQNAFGNASSENSTSVSSEFARNEIANVLGNDLESPWLSTSTSFTNVEDYFYLIVRSENIGVSLHYPLLVDNAEELKRSTEAQVDQEMPLDFSSDLYAQAALLKERQHQYVTLVLHSRDSELSINGSYATFKCGVKEASGMLDIIKDERVLSFSIFQLFQINIVAGYDKQLNQHVSTEILVDNLDVSVSHKLFYVWRCLQYKAPETAESASSQDSFISMNLKMQLRKASLLLTDETCSCNGPILEIILRNLGMKVDTTGSAMEASLVSDLLVNYFNIQKVMWEPFIETWNFLLNMTRTSKLRSPLDTSVVTDVHLSSTAHLNLNLTEPIIKVIFRLDELIKKMWDQTGLNGCLGTERFLCDQLNDTMHTKRCAPYMLQNETSLPLVFQLYRGLVNGEDLEILPVKERNIVQPGSSIPIYTDETLEEHIFRFRPPQSSDRLNEKKSYGVAHNMISIQLDGTSGPSMPISMDIVGLSHFVVNFSKAAEKEGTEKTEDSSKYMWKIEEQSKTNTNSGFVVPVVFDVSTLHYRKLIRIYSTAIFLNTTSIPLELRFDTPFGVSPKVQDHIYPGQEFPLPVHLAEAGRMSWRPLGTGFLWSEAHTFTKGLSRETKLGSFRSFVCYSSHPSTDPFRCCLSIQLISLASSSRQRNDSSVSIKGTLRRSLGNSDQVHDLQNSRTPSIHYVTITTPLVVRNYMPREVSLTIESGGVARVISISEVDCASIFHIDSSHDLDFVFHVNGFRPSFSKFPRSEAFAAVARFHENKFSQSETVTFYPDSTNGPIYVTVEKTMDAFCGARELCIFVPFLLYNCTGLPITIADLGHEMEGCTMPPCNHLIELDLHPDRKHNAILLSSKQDSYATRPYIDTNWNLSSRKHSISLKESANLHSGMYPSRHPISIDPSTRFLDHHSKSILDLHGALLNNLNHPGIRSRSQSLEKNEYGPEIFDIESRKVKPCMFFPHSSSSVSELMVRLAICMAQPFDSKKGSAWSSAFYLIPASGSTCVVVPQTNASGAFIVSVTSSPLAGPFSGRTRAITFQPRYVIINACSKDLCYKQKGTDSVFRLGVEQHSHLHWADPTRELLVSLKFNEPGSLWSGSFFPDHLGDTQVKMRNYMQGALSTVRIEVQNASGTIREEKIVGSSNGNSGTLLILLTDDKTGFMPYRIDNFSKERLRIYQEKCKIFETTVHSYMSCPYTWDEPCYPHRLVVEVLGERILGSYTLDDVTEQIPIYLPSTSEKPGRQLFLSIHADGAVKVLSIIDSSYLAKDIKDCGFLGIREKRRFDQKEEIIVDYCERMSIHIPFIGVSLIKSCSQELLFVSANDTRIDILQSIEQQKYSFQISSLQVDNQLHSTTYPVILSLDHDYGGTTVGQVKNKDDKTKAKNETVMEIASERSSQPILLLSAVKWRNIETSLVFFEYIILRLAALHLELEEEVILCLFDFVKSVTSKLQHEALACLDSTVDPIVCETGSIEGFSVDAPHYQSLNLNRGQSFPMSVSKYLEHCQNGPSFPSVVPIEDFWPQIYFLARRQNKIYVEVFDLAPIKLTLSFSSAPWMLRNEGCTSMEYPHPISGTAFQRGLMALADVEGAPVYLKQLTIAHHMGTAESFQEILIRHYTPQLLHEMYKIFGSASVIGNPMGFAKNLGLGIKDFLSVPATGILKSPSGLFTGMAHGTTSLFYSTVYAISNTATQFSKSVHKSIVAFTFDEQAVSTMEKQWTSLASHSKGVLNEILEGFTGFLQSPIRGAEKHGLPGFLSGIALGTAGLVARPVASILEVTGKTAQSIRNRSRLHQSHRFRVRFPRPLSRELPLQPYSWEEAIGISVLQEAHDMKLKNEIFVMCKTLKEAGKFLIITERLVLVVVCASLIGYGTTEFRGVVDPQWVIEVEMSLNNVIYIGKEDRQVNMVGINSENPLKQHQHKIGIRRTKWWTQSTPLPLFQMTSIELIREEEAENVLRVLVSIIEQRKEQGLGMHVLHRSGLR